MTQSRLFPLGASVFLPFFIGGVSRQFGGIKMLGWGITIRVIESSFVYDVMAHDPTGLLVKWDVGLFGCDWIEELVKQGKARRDWTFPIVGYRRWIMSAKDIIPILMEKMPHILSQSLRDDVYPFGGWLTDVTVHQQKIAQCPPEMEILIVAWDLS
jgi:hypothetical protein